MFSQYQKKSYYDVMIEIKKNKSEIHILPFYSKTPKIDLSELLQSFYFEYLKYNAKENKSVKKKRSEERFFENEGLNILLKEFRDIKSDNNIYICCFYFVVDGKKEQNAIFKTRNQVYAFGESFIKKDLVFDFENENFTICFEATFFNKKKGNIIILSDIEEKKLWVKKEKSTTIFIGKEDEHRTVIL